MNRTEITESMLESIVWIALLKQRNGDKPEKIIEFINEIVFKKS